MDYLIRLKRRFALLKSTVSIEEGANWRHNRRNRVLAPFLLRQLYEVVRSCGRGD